MLALLSNAPRDYAWGSKSAIAELEGRRPSGQPEAEVWFGDHPSDPADVLDGTGRTLADWMTDEGVDAGPDDRLPFLLKLLAAGSPLSIQVHPTKAQAEAGFAAEVDTDPAERNYTDDNHKPEIIVALSDRFEALSGIRELAATDRLLAAIGDATQPLRAILLDDGGPAAALRWLLNGEAKAEVDAILEALADAQSTEFAGELANARRIAAIYPGDPGVIVALLMNFIVLGRGEAIFLGAGRLHAYVSGLGVELMAASDNVLRGGLTSKRIDVAELLNVVDASPQTVPVILPQAAPDASAAAEEFAVPVTDFRLIRVRVSGVPQLLRAPKSAAIVLAVSGEVTVAQGEEHVELAAGKAVFVSADAAPLRLDGSGEVFLATAGAARDTP